LVVESYAEIRQWGALSKKCVAGDPDAGCRRLLDPHCT
jgi:hypothetical protein